MISTWWCLLTVVVLQPFPDWEMQEIGNPSALQYVQSMEIDLSGKMWIVDVGRLNILEADPSKVVNGPAKLVIYDLVHRQIVREFVFPDAVAPFNSSFLNDIVVDEEGGYAYISDAGTGAIVIYDFKTNQARRFSDQSTKVEPGVRIKILGEKYNFSTPADGIALSKDAKTLYYCALTGLHLYKVKTSFLQDFSMSDSEISKHVKDLGKKVSQSDGLAMASDGKLYYGGLGSIPI